MTAVSVRIIGIGNRLRGDDGIGPAVIDRILARNLLPKGVEAVEAPPDPFSLLDLITSTGKTVLVDAARMDAVPGTARIFDGEAALKNRLLRHTSLHQFSLPDALYFAQKMGCEPNLKIVAVEPFDVGCRGELSDELKNKIDEIVSLTLKEALNDEKKNSDN